MNDTKKERTEALKTFFEDKGIKSIAVPTFADNEIIVGFGDNVFYFCCFKENGELYVDEQRYELAKSTSNFNPLPNGLELKMVSGGARISGIPL